MPAREWMRICFELLEMLNAHKKGIRRASVNTFGYIAKAIGPQDVIVTLLNNLKVQERQNRVCTTVAIAIVGETCSPFTILPALMNEYKVSSQTLCQCCSMTVNLLAQLQYCSCVDYPASVSFPDSAQMSRAASFDDVKPGQKRPRCLTGSFYAPSDTGTMG